MSDGGARVTVVAAERDAGARLDRFLAPVIGSRAQAAKLIEAGSVRLGGRPLPKRYLVAAGDRFEIEQPAGAPAMTDEALARFAVAFEDDHLIVVDKPAGVVVHPSRGHWTGTLAQALAGRAAGGEEEWRAGIVHRLDRDTSGLLVVAKNDEVHRRLKAQLAARDLHRQYAALVEGIPPARSGTIDAPIGRDRRDRVLNSIDTDRPRVALTRFRVIRAVGVTSLLEVVLETGRTHQIRVHLAAIGHPVVGDRQYGGDGPRYGLERQFLHAARLAFAHPVTGEPLDLSSPLPADLQAALEAAQEGGRRRSG